MTYFYTLLVTDLSELFAGQIYNFNPPLGIEFNSSICHWDVSNVTNKNSMFLTVRLANLLETGIYVL